MRDDALMPHEKRSLRVWMHFDPGFPVTYRVFEAPEVLVNGAQSDTIEVKLPALTAALTRETLALGQIRERNSYRASTSRTRGRYYKII